LLLRSLGFLKLIGAAAGDGVDRHLAVIAVVDHPDAIERGAELGLARKDPASHWSWSKRS
jgi:hypothetical protein